MPLIESTYSPSGIFKNEHVATIYSAKLRPVPKIKQHRERLDLEDGDFLDIDFSFAKNKASKVAIILHGLEGNAQRRYIKGQAKSLTKEGWDAVAVNFRGCSGEPNKLFSSYNAGKTEDLQAVVDFLLKKETYNTMSLIGFSLGGNLMLKYLGERNTLPKEIERAVAISTPLNLKGTLESLSNFDNWVYRTSFLHNLRKKLKIKVQQFPEKMSASDLKQVKSLLDFDNLYTAPSHGFKDAYDYYKQNSSGQFLPNISIPVLILNAKNDSFLTEESYPYSFAENSENIYLETPEYGGHVGFHQTNATYYSEKKATSFLNSDK
tara:strand:+ start:297 stop:1259 length:963 start_codon:yes stop_codon:yes gene_type:complete